MSEEILTALAVGLLIFWLRRAVDPREETLTERRRRIRTQLAAEQDSRRRVSTALRANSVPPDQVKDRVNEIRTILRANRRARA